MTRRPHRRPGLLSLVSLFVLLAVATLLALVWSAVRVTTTKVSTQTAADAAAQAAGVQAARAMNMLTALMHLMGEFNARSVLAMAVYGTEYETGFGIDLSEPAAELELAWTAALESADAAIPPNAAAYEKAHRPRSRCGGAIGDARRQLMAALTAAYRDYAHAPNQAARRKARDTQDAIEIEWGKIDDIERTVPELVKQKQRVNDKIVPDLAAQARRVVESYPARAEAAAVEFARRNGATGSLFPNARGTGAYPLELPVVSEKDRVESFGWERSQAVRATTPWVQFWRQPTLDYANRELPISGYADHYRKHTQQYTIEICRRQAAEQGTYFFVLPDGTPDKGREPWTTADGSRLADRRFALLALAHSPPPGLTNLRPGQADGVLAMAQVLLYNANPQEPTDAATDWQPRVGWDTLNWDPAVSAPEFAHGDGPTDPLPEPRVRVNWRVKSVPVSLADDAVGSQDGPVDNLLRRTAGAGWLSRTH